MPLRHLQTEPRFRTRGMASACSLNDSDQHPSQARLDLSDNTSTRLGEEVTATVG